jgi:DNA-binding NarL/FixJ family response regulator
MTQIKIIIADDHPVVREGLAALLSDSPDIAVVGTAANGREAIALAESQVPDVVLMDLEMPVVDGVTAIEAIKKAAPQTQFIILSNHAAGDVVFRGIEAGAAGYLLKDARPEEIASAIRTVNAGGTVLEPSVATQVVQRIRTLSQPAGSEQVSEREREVLSLIANGASNQEIATELAITLSTVKAHVNHLLSKLGARTRAEAATEGLRRNLVRF